MNDNPLRDVPQDVRIDLDPAESMKPGDDDWNEPCAFCDGWPTIYPTGMCRICAKSLESSGRLVR